MTEKALYAELTPNEFRARLAAAPIAYLPLGTLEWHGEHLPLGADGIQSQGFFLRLAAQAGGVVLFGGIDTQDLLSFGTPDRVRREVRQLLWQLGRDGGWIASPDQGITGIPPENLAAMTETLARFGHYPLKEEDFA